MDCADYISRLSFSIWQPDAGRSEDLRLLVPRRSREDAKLAELPYAPVDVLNTVVPAGMESLHDALGPLCGMRRMSTFAVATIINRVVAGMAPNTSYVNVGTWAGFSLLSGMAGNPDRTCVGIDNFSKFGGPRDAFFSGFEKLRSPNHHFHEMDYREYFSNVHEGPIGVYFYDGEHSHENQLRGLEIAEPHFADECIVLVDDTNWPDPYAATYDFLARSDRTYTVLLDRQTASNGHPTFWNGLLVLYSRRDGSSSRPPARQHARPEPERSRFDEVPLGPDAPLVSIVLRNSSASGERVEAAIAEAHAQDWPSLEVLVADESSGTALAAAIDETRGEYVALADVETGLAPSAVPLALAFPRQTAFWTADDPAVYGRLERALALTSEITSVVPAGCSFALADARVPVPNLRTGREAVAFMDGAESRDARPANDDLAIERLAQLQSAGSAFLVLGWPAFDWLDHYPRFRDHLESGAKQILTSEQAIIFDLRH